MKTPPVLTVTQLNTYIKSVIDSDLNLNNVFVQGEISNFTNHYKTGHFYMTIKDEFSSIKAVMFKSANMRLKFEELFFIQLIIMSYARKRQQERIGRRFTRIGDTFNTFYHNYLPFPLTEAQKRVIREIHADMSSGHQMNRLLQGDVGSGKTLVA